MKHSTIIIGAGFSGIYAGKLLHENNHDFLILESRKRKGGRTKTLNFEGTQFDIGGQWVGPTQTRLYQLIKEMDLETFEQVQDGSKSFVMDDGRVREYHGLIPPVKFWELLDVQLVLWRMMVMIYDFPVDHDLEAYDHPNAEMLDGMTVYSFCKRYMWTKTGMDLMNVAIQAVLFCDFKEVSMLYWLYYCHSAGTLDGKGSIHRLLEVNGGAQQDKIVGGTGTVLDRIEKRYLRDKIVYADPVTEIQRLDDHIEIITRNGKVYMCDNVILACAPPVAFKNITFTPDLSFEKRDYFSKCYMPVGIKMILVYEHPFWKGHGSCGEITSLNKDGLIVYGFEGSYKNESGNYQPALCFFSVAENAKKYAERTKDGRKRQLIKELMDIYGRDARNPISYMEKIWSNSKWSQGAPVAITPLGLLSSVSAVHRKDPEGNIHFAGTETARVWTGYIEGALEAAERAVDEILTGKIPQKTEPLTFGYYTVIYDGILKVIYLILVFILFKLIF